MEGKKEYENLLVVLSSLIYLLMGRGVCRRAMLEREEEDEKERKEKKKEKEKEKG